MSEPADMWRERALRAAVLAGDAAAWDGWLREAFPAVAAYVRWRCGGPADWTDDVIQEAWMTAARRIRAFDPTRARFAAWVCGIAANVLRNHLRTRLRDRKHRRPLADGPEPAAPTPPDTDRVAVALAGLPERYEQALRAKYLDRLRVAEIAAAWGESEKAVESVLSRARQAFRDAYDHTPEDV